MQHAEGEGELQHDRVFPEAEAGGKQEKAVGPVMRMRSQQQLFSQ